MDDKQNDDCQLNSCLFFSSCKLARVMGKFAEEKFRITGLSPSHAFLLYLVNKNDGIQQKEIGERLHMTPSTITRFVDKLNRMGLVSRKVDGKNAYIFATEEGKLLQSDILKAWGGVRQSYSDILTPQEKEQFIATVNKLIANLEDKG